MHALVDACIILLLIKWLCHSGSESDSAKLYRLRGGVWGKFDP